MVVLTGGADVSARGERSGAAGGLGCARASEDDAGLARLGLGWLGLVPYFFLTLFLFQKIKQCISFEISIQMDSKKFE